MLVASYILVANAGLSTAIESGQQTGHILSLMEKQILTLEKGEIFMALVNLLKQ